MVFKVASLTVEDGLGAEFEAAFAGVSRQFLSLPNYIAHELQPSPQSRRYALFILLRNERDNGEFVEAFSTLQGPLEPFLEVSSAFE